MNQPTPLDGPDASSPAHTTRPDVEILSERLRVETLLGPSFGSDDDLRVDVRTGLGERPYALPPKHFYDARGAELFDAICDTPEYYQTRTEHALLERVGPRIADRLRPNVLVELGSGAVRKTPALLAPMIARHASDGDDGPFRFVPVDVAGEMLRETSVALLDRFPTLEIHGMVADFLGHLDHLPDRAGHRTVIAFLGGTMGNFTHEEGVTFLRDVGQLLSSETDALLIGMDLVKATATLHAAYNDAAGVTAAFNKNVLAVINRRLGADFDLDAFEHVAFFDEAKAQIEMHLEAKRAMEVSIPGADLQVPFGAGERIHTEISRKFTQDTAEALVEDAGLQLLDLYRAEGNGYGLALVGR